MFVTTTLAWELSHAVDGLILIVFHDRFRVLLRQLSLLWQNICSPSSVVTASVSR
ncbi:hypothetical protein COOONC_22770 [Cooperia oncophora]